MIWFYMTLFSYLVVAGLCLITTVALVIAVNFAVQLWVLSDSHKYVKMKWPNGTLGNLLVAKAGIIKKEHQHEQI